MQRIDKIGWHLKRVGGISYVSKTCCRRPRILLASVPAPLTIWMTNVDQSLLTLVSKVKSEVALLCDCHDLSQGGRYAKRERSGCMFDQ